MKHTLQTLLHELIDYAGLFPPAGLPMGPAVASYAAYRAGNHAWALGRFVLPVARLQEFEQAAHNLLPRAPGGVPWRLAALGGPDLAAELASVQSFNARHHSVASIDTLEVKAASPAEIERLRQRIPPGLQLYVELPLDGDLQALLAALSETGARAKARTGGLVPEAIPDAALLARFVAACHRAGVPFKATAGLHHPMRAEHPLTADPRGPHGTMHGFLNLLLGAAWLYAGLPLDGAEAILNEESPAAFQFDATGAAWRGQRLDHDTLAATRRELLIAFGSCSFEEPIDDLKALELL